MVLILEDREGDIARGALAGLPSEFPCTKLRQTMAINHFKRVVLGSRHIPGSPQSQEIDKAFANIGMDGQLDVRSWSDWFSQDPSVAQARSLKKLDIYVELAQFPGGYFHAPYVGPRGDFYLELVKGGLLGNLFKPTKGKNPGLKQFTRAHEYAPKSAWHLHIDAIEAAALDFDEAWVEKENSKEIAAKRLLDIIYDRWRPGQGSIYPTLSSSLKLQLEAANEAQREVTIAFQNSIRRFDRSTSEVPLPAWNDIGVPINVAATQITGALICIAADTEFLVADRFEAWVLDLVSAGLAIYAFAQTNPYGGHPWHAGPENELWDRLRSLFFDDHFGGDDLLDLRDLVEKLEAPWSPKTEQIFLKARSFYRGSLANLGVSAELVSNLSRLRSLWNIWFSRNDDQC